MWCWGSNLPVVDYMQGKQPNTVLLLWLWAFLGCHCCHSAKICQVLEQRAPVALTVEGVVRGQSQSVGGLWEGGNLAHPCPAQGSGERLTLARCGVKVLRADSVPVYALHPENRRN